LPVSNYIYGNMGSHRGLLLRAFILTDNTDKHDRHVRFLFDKANVRGEVVNLDHTWQALLTRHAYPDSVKTELAEALAAAVLLSSTLKFDGNLTFQLQGDGALNLIVVQVSADKQVRGLARWNGEISAGDLQSKMGEARLVITIANLDQKKPYQAIVPMVGVNIKECLQHYFDSSVQIPTRLWLSSDANNVAGLLLQRLPDSDNDGFDEINKQQHDEDWSRLNILTNTLTNDELLNLDTPELLYRLYHEEAVGIVGSEAVRFNCSCSSERIEATIRSLGQTEVLSIINEMGSVEVRCEFCNKAYHYSRLDADRLFNSVSVEESPTVH